MPDVAGEAIETGLSMMLADDQTEMALSNLSAIFMGYVAYLVLTRGPCCCLRADEMDRSARGIRWLEYASCYISASESKWWSVTGGWRNVAVSGHHSQL